MSSAPIPPICIAALYRFTRFEDCDSFRASLAELCSSFGIKGTLLLAREGINGTIAGDDAGIAAVLARLRSLPGCAELDVKFSRAETVPFYRMKVRVKSEIVTMGKPDIDPLAAGRYVAPQDWNALIASPDTIVIDTRNDYEVAIGSFAGAINPNIATFRDFPAWFQAHRDRLLGDGASPKIAMFCTGGIRCEKATAFLKSEGLDEVYHLEGGILNIWKLSRPKKVGGRGNASCSTSALRLRTGWRREPTNSAMPAAVPWRMPIARCRNMRLESVARPAMTSGAPRNAKAMPSASDRPGWRKNAASTTSARSFLLVSVNPSSEHNFAQKRLGPISAR